MEQHHVECQCSDFNHIFRFTLDPEDGDLWLDVRLNYYDPWYKRIWTAIKYVFKRTSRYGDYDVTMLRPEDLPRLRELLDRASQGPQEKPVLKG